MEDYPATMTEFEQRFATEQACRDYLFALRWPEGFVCPRCGHTQAWPTGRDLYLCRQCRHCASLTAGTIFQDTRKPLRQWFQAIWHVTSQKNGVSALGLQRTLGLGSYHTAWAWLHKLRRAMVRPGRDRLQGAVEADETLLGGEHAGRPGRGAFGKTLVFVAVEQVRPRVPGRIRLLRIPNASADALEAAVSACIAPGSLVRSDGWAGYNGLAQAGYARQIIRASVSEEDNPLPLVNIVSSLLKRWLLGTHQGGVQVSHLDYYLDEFTFRFNRRTSRSRGKLFYRLVQQAVAVGPVSGYELKGGSLDP
jgi:transposase-like protein